MDDLTDAVDSCLTGRGGDDRRAITAVQGFLRERGLLLGPDGLLRAEFEEMGGVRGDVPLYAHEAVT